MAKILLVDDEQLILDTLHYNLARAGYEVLQARDGEAGLKSFRDTSPDLVLLDLMLPRIDGLEVCRTIRQESVVPIMILTAKDEETDRVLGLELGADDYVTKPFSIRELLARVKALLRRAEISVFDDPSRAEMPLIAGDLEVDPARHQVTRAGSLIHLKPKEFDLLVFLMQHRGQALSRDRLLEQVWGFSYGGGSRTVDVHVRWLREKVEADPTAPQLIETVRGLGYRFKR